MLIEILRDHGDPRGALRASSGRRSCGQGVSQGFLLVILKAFYNVFRDRDCIDVVFFSLLEPFYRGWTLFNRRSCGQGVSQGFLLVILTAFYNVFRDRDCIDVVFFSLLKPFYSGWTLFNRRSCGQGVSQGPF